MAKKPIREKGKVRLSEYFKELKEGDVVSISREASQTAYFPPRMQGKTGRIEGKRGRSYVVKIRDMNEEKRYIIKPIHLKKFKE